MRFIRSSLSLFFFILFGVGGLLLSYLILPFVWNRAHALKIVRGMWWVILKGFILSRLIRLDLRGFQKDFRGCVILANHPSLIDVVILTALLPKTFSVAKSDLRRNPLIGVIVRRVFLHDDARLMDEASTLLNAGYNILIFPEGTRSPSPITMHPWHRGGTQLALRTQAPLQPIVLQYDYRLLAKGQSILDMGKKPVNIRLHTLPKIPALTEMPQSYHPLAVKLTRQMTKEIQSYLSLESNESL